MSGKRSDGDARAAAIVASADVTQALRAVQRATVEAQQATARRLELGLSDLQALEHLLGDPAPLGAVELGHRLGITSASATALVDRLERAGHLVRESDTADRRRKRLVPTEHAKMEALGVLSPMIASLNAAAAKLHEPDAQTVASYLREVADILSGYAAGLDEDQHQP
jgi:DNA-binding MarR family transcriptional regulator